MSIKVGIVIPVLNESNVLRRLFGEICQAISRIPGVYFRVVFIDDGSSDGTWAEIETFSELLSSKELFFGEVTGIRHHRNLGKTAAQISGIDGCGDCDYVVFMDSDGQHNPADINQLLEKSSALQVPVAGKRVGYSRGLFSSAGTLLLSMAMSVFGARFERDLSEFMIIPSSFLKIMSASPFFGAAPLVSLARTVSQRIDSVEIVIRKPLEPRKSRFRMSALWDKGISELLTNPSQILPKVSIIFFGVTLAAGLYGLSIGIDAIGRGELSGIGSVIVLQSVMFFFSNILGIFVFGILALLIRAHLVRESSAKSGLDSTQI